MSMGILAYESRGVWDSPRELLRPLDAGTLAPTDDTGIECFPVSADHAIDIPCIRYQSTADGHVRKGEHHDTTMQAKQ